MLGFFFPLSCPRRTGTAQKQRHEASVHLGPQVSAARTPRTSVRHSASCLHGDPRNPIRVQRDVTGTRSGVEPGLQRFPAGDTPRTDSAPVPPDPPAAGLAAACVTSGHPVWERHGGGGLSQCGYDTSVSRLHWLLVYFHLSTALVNKIRKTALLNLQTK